MSYLLSTDSLSAPTATNDRVILGNKFITVLSMDGGGVRGIIPAIVLQALEKEIQKLENNPDKRIAEYFDIISGTSAGGISATLLTATDKNGRPKFSADQLVDFHTHKWGEIFPQVRDKTIKELLWVSNLVGPMYQNTNFCKVMEEMIPDGKLSTTATNVVIPSFDIKKMKPIVFSTYEAKRDKKFDAPLKHVAVATSSAPITFPPYYFDHFDANVGTVEYNCIDGYVVADNPTWLAVTEALNEYSEEHSKSTGSISKLLILSLGTGSPRFISQYDAKNTNTWGTLQWLYSMQDRCRPYNDIFKAAATDLVDIQLRCFLKAVACTGNYLRIQKYDMSPDLIPVDNSSAENIEKLKELAYELVKKNDLALKRFAQMLVAQKHGGIIALGPEK